MRLLLDTHVFLWFIANNPSLSPIARALLEDPANDLFLSIGSLWEMAIKVSTGKLQMTDHTGQAQPFDPFLERQIQVNQIGMLPLQLPHIVAISSLPFHHRDPFDRMLTAQSLTERLPIVSADAVLDAYGVQRLW